MSTELQPPNRKALNVENDAVTNKYLRNYTLQFVMYVVYLSATIVLALSSRNVMMFYYNNFLKRHFLTRDTIISHGYGVEFDDINSVAHYWTYINNTYIRGIHEDRVYNVRNPENRRYLLEENYLMGPPRIVQKRIHSDTCEVDEHFKQYFSHCYADYSPDIEDRSGTHKGTPFEEFTSYYQFHLHSYTTGGFVKHFTYDYDENMKIINELNTTNWIDSNTRVVIFELTLYNEKSRLFHSSKIISEFTAMGAAMASMDLSVTKYDTLWSEPDNILNKIAVVIFLICVLYYSIEKVFQFKNQGCSRFWLSVWNCLESVNLIVIFICLGYQVWHQFEVQRIMKDHREFPDKYENIDVLVHYNWIYLHVNAMSVFTVFMKIFKFFTFNNSFLHFGFTLLKAFHDILGFTIIFCIVFLTYSVAGYLLFGAKHAEYHGIEASVFTTMRLMVGAYDFSPLVMTHPVMGPLYVSTYQLVMLFFFVNMFLTIISDTYVLVSSDIMAGRLKLRPLLGIIFMKGVRKIQHLFRSRKRFKKKPRDRTRLAKTTIVESFFEHLPETEGDDQFKPKEHLRRIDERISKMAEVIQRMQNDSGRLVELVSEKIRKQSESETHAKR